jgi:hypothetical protein
MLLEAKVAKLRELIPFCPYEMQKKYKVQLIEHKQNSIIYGALNFYY